MYGNLQSRPLVAAGLLVSALALAACARTTPTASPTPLPQPATPISQEALSLEGRWEGKVAFPSATLQIIVVLTHQGDGWTGTIDIPAQGAAGIPLTNVEVAPPHVHFEMLPGPRVAAFTGEVQPDGRLAGQFTQSGVEGTFDLARPVAQPTVVLPYRAEEVSFASGDITLAGTLTLPAGDRPHPALVLISGSGQQNRDEELAGVLGYRPFATIADALTRQGVAVLRYDDRGVGQSTGDPSQATTADFAADAEAALTYLLSRPDIDPDQVGLLGHSEGAIIAAMIAARNPQVAFVISMAGPAVSGYDTLLKQVERLTLAMGGTQAEADAAVQQQKAVLDLVVAQDWTALEREVHRLVQAQVESLPQAQRDALGNIDQFVDQQTAAEVQQLRSPWYQYFVAHDAGVDWAQVKVAVLALFGGKDTQVDAEQNRPALEAALRQAGNQDVTVVVLPNANHLFQEAKTGAPQEYASLSTDFDPGFLQAIGEWLLPRVTSGG